MIAPGREAITGAVLAGGLGRRMAPEAGGTDKGLRPLAGRPLASYAIDRLAPQVGTLVVNANRNLDAWRALGAPVITDRMAGFAGPLAGLHAALHWATTPWVVTAPCDSPLLPSDLVSRLATAAAARDAPIAIACTGSQPHPVFALVRRDLLDDLERFLASGRRRIDAWTTPLGAIEVPFDDERAFLNLNTIDELQRLERELDALPGRAPPP